MKFASLLLALSFVGVVAQADHHEAGDMNTDEAAATEMHEDAAAPADTQADTKTPKKVAKKKHGKKKQEKHEAGH